MHSRKGAEMAIVAIQNKNLATPCKGVARLSCVALVTAATSVVINCMEKWCPHRLRPSQANNLKTQIGGVEFRLSRPFLFQMKNNDEKFGDAFKEGGRSQTIYRISIDGDDNELRESMKSSMDG